VQKLGTTSPNLFVRNATGLTKSLGFLEQFLISQSPVNYINGVVFTFLYAPYVFPGANLVIVFLLGAIPAFGVTAVYSLFSTRMPRSGGDYVWSSRIFGGFYATIQWVFILVTSILLAAIYASYGAVAVSISGMLFSLGASTSNPGIMAMGSALTHPNVGFPVTIILFIILALITILGMKIYIWMARVGIFFYFIVTGLVVVLLLVVSPSVFPGLFNHAMAVAGSNATYTGVIKQASNVGFPSGFVWNETLLAAIPWGFFSFTGWNYGTYLAGETRNVKRSMPIALYLSLVVTAVFNVLLGALFYREFGTSFINAASTVYYSNPSYLPALPTVSMMLSLVSPVVSVMIGLAILALNILTVPAFLFAMSRMVFAASFDSLLPRKLADISDRFRTPHWAIILVSVFWGTFLIPYWYAGSIAQLLNTSLVLPIGYAMPLVAALFFYFKKRTLYEQTFGKSNPTFLIVTALIGVVSFAIYIFSEIVPISSGTYLGASLQLSLEVVVALFLVGVIIYAVGKWRTARVGLDLGRVYSEIPPE
jgi:APA family basic amino acid/polyamine antiporter